MNKMPKITEAEWVVMKVFWKQSPLTANQVVEYLSDSGWNPKTIRTLIIRLQKKKALAFEKNGREYAYFPLMAEHECVRQEAHSLLSRAGTAALKPMLAAFLREQKLSEKDIEELKQILNQRGDS
ncbi:MAG: BlaI/MecI/CopY family transcriptional regulator [Phycisphaerae bacterium]|nr:BlaI/MecI/CopY family transcriptional regulator [Phycisphaerae bacterium]